MRFDMRQKLKTFAPADVSQILCQLPAIMEQQKQAMLADTAAADAKCKDMMEPVVIRTRESLRKASCSFIVAHRRWLASVIRFLVDCNAMQ